MRMSMIVLVAVALLCLTIAASAAEMYLELITTPGRAFDPTWPPDGSQWHELYPAYCTQRTQTGHDDADGNGSIDVCENIVIDGVVQHVDWIGPTYTISRIGRPAAIMYLEPIPGKQYACYHEIYPDFCCGVMTEEPIEYVCQEVYVTCPPEDVGWWHVDKIETNIRTSTISPVEQSTWSKIKAFIGGLFD